MTGRLPPLLLRCIVVSLLVISGRIAFAAQSCAQAKIVVSKQRGELVLYCDKTIRLRAPATFGGKPQGHKTRSGDDRTPEGQYYVCTKHASRRYYRFLGLSYPGPSDARTGLRSGRITRHQYRAIQQAWKRRSCPPWKTGLGGAIGIHGLSGHLGKFVGAFNSLWRGTRLHRSIGLSKGCIVTDNDTMDELWKLVPVGTPVVIEPLVEN